MRFLVALVIAIALIAACEKPLKRCPALFYALSVLLVGAYFYGSATNATGGLWPYFLPLLQRCALAFLLFSIVMFAGALRDSSPLRTRIMAVRRQLSIMACILAVGHIAYYAASYLPRLASLPSFSLVCAFAIALALVVLMAVLFATSLLAVKQRMKASGWKSIQRLAYPFYVLIYVHLALFLAPSALAGKETAVVSLTVYTVVMAAYVLCRTRKALRRKAKAAAMPASPA